MPDYLKTIGDIAAAAAGVITVLSLIALLYKGASFIAGIPNRVRIYFFYKPRYILIPTPEELAKYCEKSFDSHKMTKYEEYEELSYFFVRMRRRFTAISRNRIGILYYSFLCVFALFGARLLYFGLMDDNAEGMSRAYTFMAVSTWFYIIAFGSAYTVGKDLGYEPLFSRKIVSILLKRFLAEDRK